ncbi:UNVERIFIED_CONTAM: hypothetical protein FKN15_051445, partial [Acipenser sinensis]
GEPGLDGVGKAGRDGAHGEQGVPGETGFPGSRGPRGPPGVCDPTSCMGSPPMFMPVSGKKSSSMKGP